MRGWAVQGQFVFALLRSNTYHICRAKKFYWGGFVQCFVSENISSSALLVINIADNMSSSSEENIPHRNPKDVKGKKCRV